MSERENENVKRGISLRAEHMFKYSSILIEILLPNKNKLIAFPNEFLLQCTSLG